MASGQLAHDSRLCYSADSVLLNSFLAINAKREENDLQISKPLTHAQSRKIKL